jgi:hypothetical protein
MGKLEWDFFRNGGSTILDKLWLYFFQFDVYASIYGVLLMEWIFHLLIENNRGQGKKRVK